MLVKCFLLLLCRLLQLPSIYAASLRVKFLGYSGHLSLYCVWDETLWLGLLDDTSKLLFVAPWCIREPCFKIARPNIGWQHTGYLGALTFYDWCHFIPNRQILNRLSLMVKDHYFWEKQIVQTFVFQQAQHVLFKLLLRVDKMKSAKPLERYCLYQLATNFLAESESVYSLCHRSVWFNQSAQFF